MNEENSTIQAVVRSVDGDQALVEVEQGGCGRCHEKGGCGGQHLTQMFCSGPKTYRVDNLVAASVGERVTVAIAAGSVRRTANLAYGVPLLSMLVGAALGTQIGGDLGAVLGAGGGLVLSVFYVRFRSRDGSGNFTERPHIISRS
ncbi:SoxR reducing system RseC family protein [Dechloromonas denitrificans]|uniref:SoxR reducing system RseC family protein n=1 Tax=Dechloromonas denitrificans TaxID=281362 RepID=UPI001CF8089E|nr:SoxR reducing system RseC family protein [Dechloromonas denitrificans]UCV01765.1 SoxR reducing system RseC family protein [Dechloromonas denitrificans]UCV06115.1 SoxR reducing system RseC family protein [Dechloromonas denitrificans]